VAGNEFGTLFRILTFGESHGPALGCVIDGCPAGVTWDQELLERELARRRPGFDPLSSERREEDRPRILSGVYDGRTLGTPITIVIFNEDARPGDYPAGRPLPRPGHADDLWGLKFGHADPRGGGRASGRETAARVAAGAVARMVLRALSPKTEVTAFAHRIGPFALEPDEAASVPAGDEDYVDSFPARFPSREKGPQVEALLLKAKEEGESWGGAATVRILRPPAGLGQPVFRKLKADLAAAFLGVGGTAGVEIGEGFSAAEARGREFHDPGRKPSPYGGIRGGISTGEEVLVRVAFKPPSTLGESARAGRHDPCIVPRALPVLEAMARLVLADHLLLARSDRV